MRASIPMFCGQNVCFTFFGHLVGERGGGVVRLRRLRALGPVRPIVSTRSCGHEARSLQYGIVPLMTKQHNADKRIFTHRLVTILNKDFCPAPNTKIKKAKRFCLAKKVLMLPEQQQQPPKQFSKATPVLLVPIHYLRDVLILQTLFLLRKNVLIYWRRWMSTLLQLLSPVFVIALLWLLVLLVENVRSGLESKIGCDREKETLPIAHMTNHNYIALQVSICYPVQLIRPLWSDASHGARIPASPLRSRTTTMILHAM